MHCFTCILACPSSSSLPFLSSPVVVRHTASGFMIVFCFCMFAVSVCNDPLCTVHNPVSAAQLATAAAMSGHKNAGTGGGGAGSNAGGSSTAATGGAAATGCAGNASGTGKQACRCMYCELFGRAGVSSCLIVFLPREGHLVPHLCGHAFSFEGICGMCCSVCSWHTLSSSGADTRYFKVGFHSPNCHTPSIMYKHAHVYVCMCTEPHTQLTSV